MKCPNCNKSNCQPTEDTFVYNDKPFRWYKCKDCQSTFSHPEELTIIPNNHSWACPICNHPFVYDNETITIKNTTYKIGFCPNCQKNYYRISTPETKTENEPVTAYPKITIPNIDDFHCQCGEKDIEFTDSIVNENRNIYLFTCPKCGNFTAVLEEIPENDPNQVKHTILDPGFKECKYCGSGLYEGRIKPRRRICLDCGYDNAIPSSSSFVQNYTAHTSQAANYLPYVKPFEEPDKLFVQEISLNKPIHAKNK